MRIPSREALLSELDKLNHGARLRRVALLGRDGKDSPELKSLMSRLLSGGAHEGLLALEMARAARDGDILLRGLTHPSCQVQGRAATFAGRFVLDDTALERRLPGLAPFVRRRVLKGLAHARRSALAARLFPLIRARHGAAEAALLLPALDPAALHRLLPELAHQVNVWRSLVHQMPDAVLAFLRDTFAQASGLERVSLFQRYHVPLQELTLSRADAVLALVQDFAPPDHLPAFVTCALPRLVRRHPEQILALLLRPAFRATLLHTRLPRGALRELKTASADQRRALARALAEEPSLLARFLAACPPSERPALFAHAFEGTAPRAHPDTLLTVLPLASRDAEATRQLGLREVREDRDRRLAMLALRAIEHAREPLRQAASASKAEDRARALTLLVACTGLSRRGLTETLAALARLRNEQDPVRHGVLLELSRLPLSLFAPEHVPALESLVTYAVEAQDTSLGTHNALQALALRLLRQYATAPDHPLFRFALETVKRLAVRAGALHLPSLERDLPRGAEHHLFAALLPLIRAANERESHGMTLTLARALGRRAWNLDMLQTHLATVTESTPDTGAQEAIGLWLAPPRTRDARVRELLDRDESHVVLYPVLEHLHRRRQEWLDPFLKGRSIKGRFSTGKTIWVPAVFDGFHRWVPRQQEQLRDLLLRIAADTERSAFERMRVLHVLPRLSVVDMDTLAPFLASPDVPTVEAALGALAALDQPEPALPLLLDALDGDRARVAMYAVPRVARRVAPEVLSTTLGTLLARERLKVTVHKEALRLLGAFRSPRSLPLLREQWDNPRLHKDVRIAVGHAARQLLDEPAAWELLEAIARSPEADVAASLLEEAPARLPPEARPRYAALLLQVSRHPEPTVRRRAFTGLAHWASGMEDTVAREAAGRVLDIAQGIEWREALGALVGTTREGKAFEHVEDCAARLVSAPLVFNATTERDLPERQRLEGLIRALLGQPLPVRVRLRTHLETLARVLAREPSLWPESAALRLAGLQWKDVPDATRVLLALAEETREEPLFASGLSATVASAVDHRGAEWTPEGLLQLAQAVTGPLPLVAVVLVSAAGRRLNWREDAAQALRALRQHPRPSVRAAAFGLLTASE
ncbi:hypothetical protein CYFUS_002081 [Cystobacter fuscus]|uniref:HEAT repeat domain-containing protein n=1 Tax=Cystobacter fuscus TaxID=43 RepID=A0A250J0H1_9BACT|nr:hypothetical protein [Cystobacter fuscus]ATB36666.1 hypothetical protein CYFUS_002081 [Cystobacter fuscus]